MVNKVYYIMASLMVAASSCYVVYYCKKVVDKGDDEPVTVMDEIEEEDVYCELGDGDEEEDIDFKECQDDVQPSSPSSLCHRYHTKFNCLEPLRMSNEMLETIGDEGSKEIIYNICEIITLLDAYISKENLMTHQVVTVNYPLAKLVGFQKDASITYNLLLNILLDHHVSKY